MASEESAEQSRRQVPALLVEATPTANAASYWVLASPFLIFLGWLWVDLFAAFSPIPFYLVDLLLGLILYTALIVLPLGYAAHRAVTALPVVFQHAGWDVQPLEPVRPQERYTVNYVYEGKQRAATTRQRIWLRVAQGWVYLEIGAILAGAVLMVPLFFSAREFGFGG